MTGLVVLLVGITVAAALLTLWETLCTRREQRNGKK